MKATATSPTSPRPTAHALTTPMERALVFALAERVGKVPLARIQEAFGSMPRAFAAGRASLESVLGKEVAEFVFGPAGRSAVAEELRRADVLGAAIVAEGEAGYPALLQAAEGRPAVLYRRGSPEALERPAVAIVGTRRPTAYGKRIAFQLGRDLAARGACVVSGLAMGIDAAAHAGALAAGGATVAVLGSGVDTISPRTNLALGQRMLMDGGALLSEFPIGTPGRKHTFPRRNRVIAGISLGVVVVEASDRSGSFHTAVAAGDAGREVMAVPGPVDGRQSLGTNQLLREGAALVRDAADVLEELGLHAQPAPTRADAAKAPEASRGDASIGETSTGETGGGETSRGEAGWQATKAAEARRAPGAIAEQILDLLADQPLDLDELGARTRRPSAELLAALTDLELAGRIVRDGGCYATA